jgi:acylphosphatase
VRNLPDGRVELVMEGDTNEMDHLIESVENRMNGYIKNVAMDTLPATGEFDQFYIRH